MSNNQQHQIEFPARARVHEPVASQPGAAKVPGVVNTTLADGDGAKGVTSLLGHCCGAGYAYRRLSAGAEGTRSGWSTDYRNMRYGPGSAKVATSGACSWWKSRWQSTRSSCPSSVRAGIRRSDLCGRPARKLIGPTGTPGCYSSSSESLASPALLSCLSANQRTWAVSCSASWLMAELSNKLLPHSTRLCASRRQPAQPAGKLVGPLKSAWQRGAVA